jgi:hypothetical protein
MMLQFWIYVISWLNMENTSVPLNTIDTNFTTSSIAIHEATRLQNFLVGIHLRNDAEGSCEAPKHIHI